MISPSTPDNRWLVSAIFGHVVQSAVQYSSPARSCSPSGALQSRLRFSRARKRPPLSPATRSLCALGVGAHTLQMSFDHPTRPRKNRSPPPPGVRHATPTENLIWWL
jgi:hypothetical protein